MFLISQAVFCLFIQWREGESISVVNYFTLDMLLEENPFYLHMPL